MYRTLATLGGAIMALSILAPWISGPFGQTLIPWDFLRLLYEQLGTDVPLEPMLFYSTFAAAAFLALLAILGLAPQLLTLLVGLYPVGLLVAAYFYARDSLTGLGVTVPEPGQMPDFVALWQEIGPIIGNGLWMYLGGMLALILAGLAGGRR